MGGHPAFLGNSPSEEGPGPISGLGEAVESAEEGGTGMQDGWGQAGRAEQGQDRLSGALFWQVVHQSHRGGPRAPWVCAVGLGSCMSYKAPPWESQHQGGERWGFHPGPGMRSGLSTMGAGRREASAPRRASQHTEWCRQLLEPKPSGRDQLSVPPERDFCPGESPVRSALLQAPAQAAFVLAESCR